MKNLISPLLCACPLALTALASVAAPAAPASGQSCSDTALGVVGHFLKLDHFNLPSERPAPASHGIVTSAACKRHPLDPRLTIVTAAYVPGTEGTKALVIALVDEAGEHVAASYRDVIQEDATMQVDAGSLHVDTPPYTLAPGVRAFGLDLTRSSPTPRCAEGGWGKIRSLYLQDGMHIRPILQDLPMSGWTVLQSGRSGCNVLAGAPGPTVVENMKLVLSMSDKTSHGHRDIIVKARSTRDDGIPSTRPGFHYTLRYDGKTYPSKGMTDAFRSWRDKPLAVNGR